MNNFTKFQTMAYGMTGTDAGYEAPQGLGYMPMVIGRASCRERVCNDV